MSSLSDQDVIRTWVVEDLRVPATLSDGRRPLFVKLHIGNLAHEADLSQNGSCFENSKPLPPLQARPSDTAQLYIFARHRVRRDKCVGEVKYTIQDLIAQRKSNDSTVSRIPIRLTGVKNNQIGRQEHIEFSIRCPSDPIHSEIELFVRQSATAAQQVLDHSHAVGALASTDDIQPMVAQAGDFLATWQLLFDRVGLFVKACDQVAEIHPYAKMAWSVLSFIPKTILHQVELDERVKTLVEAMSGLFDFVEDAQQLIRVKSHGRILILMTQQVTECGYFISSYTEESSFWKRAFKHMLSAADKKMDEYLTTIDKLKQEFQLDASRQVSITVMSIADRLDIQNERLETLVIDSMIDKLPYSKTAVHIPEKCCLPGTRKAIIDGIITWASNPDGASVFLLTGVAGSGKSSIVHTAATLFREQRRLGSSVCFDKSDHSDEKARQLFSTIARDLASHDQQIKHHLYEVIKKDESLLRSPPPREQFQKLIQEATLNIEMIGPSLVMIDALDETPVGTRAPILDVLSTSQLPGKLRFLIASRPEEDIITALKDQSHVLIHSLDKSDKLSTENDIHNFIVEQFSRIRGMRVRDFNARELAQRSEGLFQWASTMCRFVSGGERPAGVDHKQRLDRILRLDSTSSHTTLLDKIYREVVIAVTDPNNPESFATVKHVLGLVLTLVEPITMRSLELLFSSEVSALQRTLPYLGSLLSGVDTPHDVVRPLHTSLRDFFFDKTRAGDLYIDTEGHHVEFAHASFRVLDSLRFNMGNISTSYNRNDPMSAKAIPEHLKYACVFFSRHLELSDSDELLNRIKQFLHRKFLFWLEVLSLTGNFPVAASAMDIIITQIRIRDPNLANFALDLQRFTRAFATPISQSAPHIYISALPLSPRSSGTYQHFRSNFPRSTPLLSSGGLGNWPILNICIRGHEAEVNSVTFSHDGRRILSGSQDKTVRVWDAETGDAIGEPLRGHENWVSSVAFSPDGKKIASGSYDETVRVWDAETGDAIGEPLRGHENWVTSVVFSPDGKRIASGSYDETVRVWDAETGDTIGEPLRGHEHFVSSVAFSPDGKKIASGSYDETVRVWDAETGDAIGEPLRGHEHFVSSVAFSPDGKKIASGSYDETVRVWDAETGDAIGEPLRGHENWVTSVAFSPDGKKIASGSEDKTVRVWDAETGDAIGEPLRGHEHFVSSVAFSPDGKKIASGSYDKTVRVWDAETGDAIGEPLRGHENCARSVAFSPDGKKIASGSYDETVRVWDAETGDAIGEPLRGHENWVTSVVFSPDGKRIASGSYDETVRVWDAETGDAIGEPLRGHENWVTSVAFSPDGKKIASGSEDKTVRVWDAETGDAIGEP